MPECDECGDDYSLDDGCDPDGMCHQCAHSIAETAISTQVSARDLTIRDMRSALQESRSSMVAAETALKVSGAGWSNVRTDLRASIAKCDALLPANHPDAFRK